MFGTLGGPELLLIFIIALIVFGPRKLPEIGKSLGKMMAEFRKASNDFKQTIESEVEAERLREAVKIDPFPPSPAASSAAPALPPPATPAEGNEPGTATPTTASAPPTESAEPATAQPAPAHEAAPHDPHTVARSETPSA